MSLEQVRRRRQAIGTIHDVVSAMRAIAAGRIQAAQRALASARRYQEVILRGLAALKDHWADVLFVPGNAKPTLLVVFTAEQPLCGAFNQNVLALAELRRQQLRQQGKVHLLAIGQRGIKQLLAHGLVPDSGEAGTASLPGLRDLVKRLAALVDRRFAQGQLGALHVIYNRYQSISEQVPTEERIFPLDLDKLTGVSFAGKRPFRYLPIPTLLAGLVSEYAFINMYRLAAESYASEQASRLVAMDGATRNTEKMLETLKDLERRERQGLITRQVLELIGARLASQPPPATPHP